MGPLRYLSCAKFESFHQISKKYANVVKSRKNIIATLALKLQLELTYRFLCRKRFTDRIEFGRTVDLSSELKIKFSQEFSLSAHEVSFVKINGMHYKTNHAIYLCNENNDPVFGIVTNIVTDDDKRIFLVYKKCVTDGFNNHIKGYLISRPKKSTSTQLAQLDLNNYVKSIKIHHTAGSDSVITRRDVKLMFIYKKPKMSQ